MTRNQPQQETHSKRPPATRTSPQGTARHSQPPPPPQRTINNQPPDSHVDAGPDSSRRVDETGRGLPRVRRGTAATLPPPPPPPTGPQHRRLSGAAKRRKKKERRPTAQGKTTRPGPAGRRDTPAKQRRRRSAEAASPNQPRPHTRATRVLRPPVRPRTAPAQRCLGRRTGRETGRHAGARCGWLVTRVAPNGCGASTSLSGRPWWVRLPYVHARAQGGRRVGHGLAPPAGGGPRLGVTAAASVPAGRARKVGPWMAASKGGARPAKTDLSKRRVGTLHLSAEARFGRSPARCALRGSLQLCSKCNCANEWATS